MTNQGDSRTPGRTEHDAGGTVTRIASVQRQRQSSEVTPLTAPRPTLQPVTRRGRLVLAPTADLLELETANGRFELLGPYGTEAHEGDEVEVTGLPDPTSRSPHVAPAILVRQMRRLA